jgi:hypothetical protein
MEKRSFIVFTVVVALGSLLTSCNKFVADKQVYVDSYIHAINNRAGIPVYNVVHSAFSYSALKDVSVTGSTGSAIGLTRGTFDAFSFYSPIDSAAYKTTLPAADIYTYTGTYDTGDSFTVSDLTSGGSLAPAQGMKATKSATDIVLDCSPVANAEAYKIRIFYDNDDGNPRVMIDESNFLVPTSATANLTIPFSLVDLSQYLNYYLSFEVSAFIFEQGQNTFEAVSTATVRNKFVTSP